MPLNLTLLRSFYAVIEAGSISKASRTGYASQPGLSKAVRELEKQLGIALLERNTQGSTPTKAGAELFEYARAIFALEARAEDAIIAHKDLTTTTLHIGASTTVATYILPPLLHQFSALHSGVSISLFRGNAREIEAHLWSYELDVALITGPTQDEKIQQVAWREDQVVCVCAPTHPLAKRELVFLNDLKCCIWIMREVGSGTREIVEKALKPYAINPVGKLEIGGCEALKQTVATGDGIAFVSRQAAADQIALGKLKVLRVADLEIRMPFFLLHLPDRPLSPAARAFESFLLKGKASVQ